MINSVVSYKINMSSRLCFKDVENDLRSVLNRTFVIIIFLIHKRAYCATTNFVFM